MFLVVQQQQYLLDEADTTEFCIDHFVFYDFKQWVLVVLASVSVI